jgi:hypothetical protein
MENNEEMTTEDDCECVLCVARREAEKVWDDKDNLGLTPLCMPNDMLTEVIEKHIPELQKTEETLRGKDQSVVLGKLVVRGINAIYAEKQITETLSRMFSN